MKVHVIEDDYGIQELLRYNLEKNGYEVIISDNGYEGYSMALKEMPDIILLDIMIPGTDGLEVCKMIRMNELTRNIPIIMVTAKGEELDKVLGLELGADDYVTKPFSVKELIARIRTVLRRVKNDENFLQESENQKSKISFGNLEIDVDKYEVKINAKKIILTLKEFELLRIMAENPGKVMTRDFLLDAVWGYEFGGETRTVDVHVSNLRRKLWGDNEEGMIKTVRGVGYKFEVPGDL
ncbi:two-component system, OmpR family, alkaline phosphatase synthesis response regulator PhoP [Lutispora thermophila DSM 19022]|uniref:Stage 0 sporulation protein A homolog n=1 Tax=Lutispora thermophila DSM 19022 TaxID=1122184 RepID=A0A1M6CP00_9FIRM|nr:two-component system, OmpR family, alkaline phosphatase synthesis response regulator PhoP [Lutispora thermophila DSM 19022]